MSTLFRKEVFEAKTGDWLGTIRLYTPLSLRLLTIASMVFGSALVLFLVFGQYVRREATTGVLVPAAGLVEVTAITGGTISNVHVTEGAPVKAGDPVFTISSERASSALGDTAKIISTQLLIQRSRVNADLETHKALEQKQTLGLKSRIGLLYAQLGEIDGQILIQRRQLASAVAMLDRLRALLAQGYVTTLQVQQQEIAVLDAEGLSKSLARQRIDLQQNLETANESLAQLPLTMSAERNSLERLRADIDRSNAENELQRAMVLRAPRSGVAAVLLVKPGQSVAPGQQLLTILPVGSPLQARLMVPSSAIGFIRPGNRVVIRYRAFPYQKFGLHYGRVDRVGRSALTPAQVASSAGLQSQEPVYRVDVDLDSQSIDTYGVKELLKPGMEVEADVMLDKRRLIEWIFEPLYGVGRKLGSNSGE